MSHLKLPDAMRIDAIMIDINSMESMDIKHIENILM